LFLGTQSGFATDPSTACTEAAQVAEQAHGLPPGLLLAIGRVESGRVLAGSSRPVPWPWAINVEGRSLVLENTAEAITAIETFQAQGARSIDVGCFQVNLIHHPSAFASLDQAFTPAANADYAASFLTELRARSGDWATAVGWYHSTTPELAEHYRQLVWAAWQGVPPPATPIVAAAGAVPRIAGTMPPFMRIFTPTTASLPLAGSLPVVFRPARRG
jgi:hypothetical protein